MNTLMKSGGLHNNPRSREYNITIEFKRVIKNEKIMPIFSIFFESISLKELMIS